MVGPAANEVARLEGLTKKLGHRVLVSGEFAAVVSLDWQDLGPCMLDGVAKPLNVLTLPEGEAASA